MNKICNILRPFCFENLQGLAIYRDDKFVILDSKKGYLATIDSNNNTTIINSKITEQFRNASGIDYYEKEIWFAKNKRILKIKDDFLSDPEVFVILEAKVTGVVTTKTEVYVATTNNQVHVFENDSDGKQPKNLRSFNSPGIGADDLTFYKGNLWICDSAEQTVYCLDPDKGKVKFSLLVPFEFPTGIAFFNDQLYIAYCNEEFSICDQGSGETLDLAASSKNRNFIHQLHFQNNEQEHYTLSGGYLIEVSYVEEIYPVESSQDIDGKFKWWIGLPNNSKRQELIDTKPIGRDFKIEQIDDQKFAVFSFNELKREERHLLGWQALVKVHAIKYNLKPEYITDDYIPPDIKEKYLKDDDDLAMDTEIVQKAAIKATKGAKNIFDKVLKIRNYVYEQLSYKMEGSIDPPDVVLRRGNGSCGEYLGVLMALTRLNNIPSRKAGRYKVPYYKINPETREVPVEPDFNHVWLEFYVPGYGWIPMESSADDDKFGDWTMRYFMALQWYHIDLQRGLSFEKLTGSTVFVGDLSINHIRFRIIEELDQ